MRRRLVRNTILVTVMVLAVLATPVVLLLRQSTEDELRSGLAAQATAIGTNLSNQFGEAFHPTPSDLAGLVNEGDRIEVRDASGMLLAASGPAITDGFSAVATGPSQTMIEVITNGRDLRRRLTSELILLGVLASGGVLLAAVLAAIFGARVSRPLEQLAASAARLGAGDFSAALPPSSGIREIDDIRSTLSTSASRLDKTLSAERSFTGDATHQLRTGLTGIALQLQLLAAHDDEAVRADANHALAQTDRLTATLDELLDLARGGRGSQRVEVHLHEIALEHRGDWLHRFQIGRRGLLCHGTGTPVLATPGFVGQIIDILLDNSLRHGRGDVRIDVAERQLRVTDEGLISERVADGLFDGSDDPAAPHGRGLALARRLAQADGGRLELVSRSPTTFVLTMPTAHSDAGTRHP
ncbi:MAG: putative two-component histidine kinase [Acidimicrobiales bacterium]|nr:putative two-component histidine kinase [Acidimicrobiales bacterium]